MYKNGLFIALLTILICQSSLFAKESLFYTSKTLDIPLAIISASTALTGLYFIKDTEVPNSIKDKSSLLPWDKPFAGTYSENADLWSDILNAGLLFPIAISGTALAQNDIQKNDTITFWGTCEGESLYESISGSDITLPKINIRYYELLSE